jgi:hypothetical protein
MKLKHLLGAAAVAVVLAGPAFAEDISIAVVGPMTGQLANTPNPTMFWFVLKINVFPVS